MPFTHCLITRQTNSTWSRRQVSLCLPLSLSPSPSLSSLSLSLSLPLSLPLSLSLSLCRWRDGTVISSLQSLCVCLAHCGSSQYNCRYQAFVYQGVDQCESVGRVWCCVLCVCV